MRCRESTTRTEVLKRRFWLDAGGCLA